MFSAFEIQSSGISASAGRVAVNRGLSILLDAGFLNDGHFSTRVCDALGLKDAFLP